MGFFSSLSWFVLSFLFTNSPLGVENNNASSSTSISHNANTSSCNNKSHQTITTSNPAQGACMESTIDRLTILPDDVAYYVLSFLSLRDLARVGTVSKRCRELFLSVPYLDFDLSTFPRDREQQVNWLNCLDRFLVLRGDNNVFQFHIRWPSFISAVDLEHFRIITWIHNAVRCNVVELDIDCRNIGMTLPSCIFCPSLRSLSVNLHNMTLNGPFSSVSCNLYYLTLKSVRIVDERFCEWISHSCNCLKELQLIRVRGIQNITIKSSSLESLELSSDSRSQLQHVSICGEKLEVIHIDWRHKVSFQSSKSLNISAPNLKCLSWMGNLVDSQNLGKLMNLETARIYMAAHDNLFEVFSSICRVKVLIVDDGTIKALSREGSTPPLLYHTRQVGINLQSLTDNIVMPVVSLLQRLPNLNSLVLECTWHGACECDISGQEHGFTASRFDSGYWKSQKLVFLNQLEEVTIKPSNESNEFEFARYILENAPNLKKMVIVLYSSEQEDKMLGLVNCKMISTANVVVIHEETD